MTWHDFREINNIIDKHFSIEGTANFVTKRPYVYYAKTTDIFTDIL